MDRLSLMLNTSDGSKHETSLDCWLMHVLILFVLFKILLTTYLFRYLFFLPCTYWRIYFYLYIPLTLAEAITNSWIWLLLLLCVTVLCMYCCLLKRDLIIMLALFQDLLYVASQYIKN